MTKLTKQQVLTIREIVNSHKLFILNMSKDITTRYPSIYICVMKYKPSQIIATDAGFNATTKTSFVYQTKNGTKPKLCNETELSNLEKELETALSIPFCIGQFRYM